jgi:fido (protein-threonine AMPylation protein)
MGLNLEYPPGATPLDPDDAAGLIPSHITTQGQLNEWEFQNVAEGTAWALSRKRLPRCPLRASGYIYSDAL